MDTHDASCRSGVVIEDDEEVRGKEKLGTGKEKLGTEKEENVRMTSEELLLDWKAPESSSLEEQVEIEDLPPFHGFGGKTSRQTGYFRVA